MINFIKFELPIIRQTFPSLIAKDIVNIQPMNSPDRKIFNIKFLREITFEEISIIKEMMNKNPTGIFKNDFKKN